jgi:hypothetical protein
MMRFGSPTSLTALLLAGGATRALAQRDTVPVTALVYREVRLSAPRFAPLELRGTVVGADSAGLSLVPTGGVAPATVPRATIERVRILERPGMSLQWGTVGMLVRPVVGYRVLLWQANQGGHTNHEEDALYALAFGVPVGALAGAIVGAELGRARWREVRIRR